MIVVTFRCGHRQNANGSEASLACGQCGETFVLHVDAPAPKFRGTVTGPHAEFVQLEPKAVTFETEKKTDAQ